MVSTARAVTPKACHPSERVAPEVSVNPVHTTRKRGWQQGVPRRSPTPPFLQQGGYEGKEAKNGWRKKVSWVMIPSLPPLRTCKGYYANHYVNRQGPRLDPEAQRAFRGP